MAWNTPASDDVDSLLGAFLHDPDSPEGRRIELIAMVQKAQDIIARAERHGCPLPGFTGHDILSARRFLASADAVEILTERAAFAARCAAEDAAREAYHAANGYDDLP